MKWRGETRDIPLWGYVALAVLMVLMAMGVIGGGAFALSAMLVGTAVVK